MFSQLFCNDNKELHSLNIFPVMIYLYALNCKEPKT
jgi:hypothetical protein